MADDELNPEKLFAGLLPERAVGLAISGGADSLALMHLFAAWRQGHPLPDGKVDLVLTVDHGLRLEAADELDFVQQAAEGLGFKALGLALAEFAAGPGLQARAREARYQAMGAAMREAGITQLLTGHTLDDQAETVLMRLKRGSGVDGLAAMAPVQALFGVELIRPLLGVTRARLRAHLKSAGQTWVEDPSNDNPDFERVALRRLFKEIDAEGDLRGGMARTARRLRRSREALEVWTLTVLNEIASVTPLGVLTLRLDRYLGLPDEIRLRVLGRVFMGFGGGMPGLAQLEEALGFIEARGGGSQSAAAAHALGGVLMELRVKLNELIFTREWARAPLERREVLAGQLPLSLIWDNRIAVRIEGACRKPLVLRGFSEGELRCAMRVLRRLAETEGAEAMAADQVREPEVGGLLTLWCGAALLALPQLSDAQMQALQAGLVDEGLSEAVDSDVARGIEVSLDYPLFDWNRG